MIKEKAALLSTQRLIDKIDNQKPRYSKNRKIYKVFFTALQIAIFIALIKYYFTVL